MEQASITASNLLEYLFCARFTYFELYLGVPQHEEKRFKVQQGWTVHDDKARINPDYLRKKIGCTGRKQNIYLVSEEGFRGIVDEILFLKNGEAAPLDYKYAEYKDRTFKNHQYQLALYGALIKEYFRVPVNRGYIIYARSRNKLVEVNLTEKMYSDLRHIIRDLLEVVKKGVHPGPTKYSVRCADCCYGNICEQVI